VKVEEIPIDKIKIPEERARSSFTEEQHAELKASIQQHGFTIPILVKPLPDGSYELIDGEHRIQVAKGLGFEKIPAVITDADEKKATLLNILANTARGTQNPMDVAEALRRAYEGGATIEELAAATGHQTRWVKLYLTLTELPEEYKQALREGKLKVGHIEEAMRLPNPVEIDAALQSALVHGWNVKVLKYYVEQRMADLQRAQAAGNREFLETPPTPQYAETLVSYGDCMICKRKVNRADLSMPTICADCRTLLEYIVSQLGDPREAMQTIYNALNLYFDVIRRKKKGELEETPESQPRQESQLQVTEKKQTEKIGELELSEEDIRLIRLIKLLKKEGLL